MSLLIEILSQIKSSNEKYGLMSKDESNERVLDILSQYGLEDDEDQLQAEFGLEGEQAIRDAEQGIYLSTGE